MEVVEEELTADGRSVDDALAVDEQSSGTDETLVEDARSVRPELLPAVPERIGRYRLIRRIGAGGMGLVYEAHDDRADRLVALKLLRGAGGRTERLRLLREAQALAQLSHPNVVKVFEVGTLDERGYLVMELVDGTSLDRWLAAAPRRVAEILDVLVQSGEGLAAAHAAGLVHRDFKPGNVLIGADGQVRVADFGLARATAGLLSEESVPSGPMATVWSQNLTNAGSMLGTPAYMSPEQFGSEPVTAQSDQFAFCVTLYQAIWDQHPFAEDGEVQQVLHNVLHGDVRPPPATREVPPRVRAAVLRGLSSDPQARWPSMTPLLHELRASLRPPRWPRPAAAAVAVAMVVAAGGAWMLLGRPGNDPARRCIGAEAKLDEAWGPSRRAAVEQAFLATKLPYAGQTWVRVGPLLDDYGEAWRSTHAQACEDGGARELDLRMACIERLRQALAAQVQILEQADAAVVEQAVAAVTGLRPPATCLQTDTDELAPPADPELAARVAALESQLDRVEAFMRCGKYQAAATLAEEVLYDGPAREHLPLEARATILLAEANANLGSFATAEQQLERAYFLGQRLEDRELVLESAEQLVMVVGVSAQDHERGLEWARHAEAALGHDGQPLDKARFLNVMGTLRRERGEYAEALEAHQESLRLYRSVVAPESIQIANALSSVGVDLRKLDRNKEALRHHEQAVPIAEAALGSAHPEIASKLNNLATAQLRVGQREQAVATMQRAIAIREANLGPDSVVITKNLTSLAVILMELRRYDEAERAAQRAIVILEAAGTQPYTLCVAAANLAEVRHAAGRYEQAAESHRRAIATCEEAGLEDHTDFTQVLLNFGKTLERLGQLEQAEAVLRRALAILERSNEPMTTRTLLIQEQLMSVTLAKGRFEQVVTDARQWIALEPVSSPPPYYRASVEWKLARAHWGAGRREPALAHARDAEQRAAALDDGIHAEQLRADVRAWRTEHDPELDAPAAP